MKTPTLMFILACSLLFTGAFLSGCESAAKKSTEANENLRDAKSDLDAAEKEAAAAAQKAADAADWKLFKTESEGKIATNESLVAQMKDRKKTSGKVLDAAYTKAIEELEQKNKDLRARMDAYDKGQTDWQAFKSEFNRDMDALGKAIGDLGKNNKK
jgi:predicted  nucleic acid-binding Zn-ribbon protein